MPIYEYRCKICGYAFERLQPISAEPLRRCPKCGSPVKRLIGTGIGVIFKGSGFYETDYKRKSNVPEKPKTKARK
ncbi:MAG: FmdB family zinc ribbon protein [candidate division WOR-3 bacterium]|jgi:putative FmdB family regulatory protein|nr:FmdB family zinc ribbon protein [candidate division WOR-3 bacterium]